MGRIARSAAQEDPTDANAPLLAGVELGGTKCICILGTGPDDIREREVVRTTRPDETLGKIEWILGSWSARYQTIAALGIASFGPLNLQRDSPTYGYIRATSKPHWTDTDVRGRLARSLGVPIGFNTDVNGAALAERRWGSARGFDALAYITVGTGVGVGLIVAGRPVLGFGHPELGHIRVARMVGDSWAGSCPFHGDCVEGLASGPAIAARTGVATHEIPAEHRVWESVAFALSQLAHNLVLTTAPDKILLGGGVLTGRPYLLQRVREHCQRSLNGYVRPPDWDAGLARYLVAPGLGDLAGPMGALALAAETVQNPSAAAT